jgi:hypothetical protein
METGDPVVGIGFAMGVNTFEQGPNPNGTQSADGYYHPEDEVFLPWFMRLNPNPVAEPRQGSANGRYTLMGDRNRFPGFSIPARAANKRNWKFVARKDPSCSGPFYACAGDDIAGRAGADSTLRSFSGNLSRRTELHQWTAAMVAAAAGDGGSQSRLDP